MGAEPTARDAQDRLASVIAEAWTVFGRYHFGRPLEVCRCDVCVQPNEEAALLATPIREIGPRLLQVYTESAHSSGGVADDQFRALLPRYFELIAYDDWPAHSSEITLKRLDDAQYRVGWPPNEVDLIDRTFVALFGYWLDVNEGTLAQSRASELLGLVAIAGGEIEPLLAVWDADRSLSASLRLADTILGTNWSKRVGHFGAFWEDMQAREDAVLAWLRRPEQKARLAAAFFTTNDPGEQERLSAAEQVL